MPSTGAGRRAAGAAPRLPEAGRAALRLLGAALWLLGAGLPVIGVSSWAARAGEAASPETGETAPPAAEPAHPDSGDAARPDAAETAPPSGQSSGVQPLGPEDLIEITVFEIPDLSRTVRITGKGTVSLPLLGEVMVKGLTPAELEARLREQLGKRYLENPQVSVFVREHGSRKVSVLGAVGKPGVYEMLGPRTLLQVLSQAGGLTQDAGAELFIIRDPDEKIAINVQDLMASRDPALNVAIRPGDIVSAPIDRALYIYVDGAVKTPGRIEQLASRPITLLQAIAKAGGATDRANLKKVQILRQGEAGTQTVIAVDAHRVSRGKEPDPVLREGDVVVVPETFF